MAMFPPVHLFALSRCLPFEVSDLLPDTSLRGRIFYMVEERARQSVLRAVACAGTRLRLRNSYRISLSSARRVTAEQTAQTAQAVPRCAQADLHLADLAWRGSRPHRLPAATGVKAVRGKQQRGGGKCRVRPVGSAGGGRGVPPVPPCLPGPGLYIPRRVLRRALAPASSQPPAGLQQSSDMAWVHAALVTATLLATGWAADKQIKLEDIERDNLKSSKEQVKPQQFQQPQPQPEAQQYLQLSPAQLQQLQQQAYLQVLPPGGQFAYYPSLPAFPGNQVQAAYVSPEQAQALAAQYQQALPPAAYLAGLGNQQYVPAALAGQPTLQARPQDLRLQQEQAVLPQAPRYVQQEVPAQQYLQYLQQQQLQQQQLQQQQQQLQQQQQQQASLQQFQSPGVSREPHSLQSRPEAPEPTVQYSSGEVYSTIPYSSKQDYSVQLTSSPRQQQQQQYILQQQFQQGPPRPYNPYNALLHPQQQKTLFAAGAKSTVSPPVKSQQGGFIPSASIAHPGQGFSFSNYRRGPPGSF
ncbi:uncharacterized protein LOC134528670 [Bacillus rossius redtenbacheri]|uniref:uncharacterized protein LOC134528670 n=1 Tax=Bacillus rossius redtenbacheri TaxID=93214 RepID=UPI002FDD6DFE